MTETTKRKRYQSLLKKTCPYCGKVGGVNSMGSHILWCNPANPPARFWSRVDKRGANECWEWKGQLRWDGYGRFIIGRKPQWTHRYSWELHNGKKIPPNGHILHSCHNPACVNPKHLSLGTHKENMAQMQKEGRFLEALAIAKEVAHAS